MSPKSLNPERIRLARLRRGYSKRSLAQILDVSDRTIMNYEAGAAPYSAAHKLGVALTYPEEYFVRETDIEVDGESINYRAGRDTTRKNRNVAVASCVNGIEISQWINRRFTLPKVHLPTFNGENPCLAAQLLREEWGLGTKPLPNLVQLCESRGITVFGLPRLSSPVDAFSIYYEAKPYIYLSRQKTPERTRFDIAHELGHLVLHKNSGRKPVPEQEKEADRFASEFLMPRSALAEHIPDNAKIEAIMRGKYAFKVSAMALTYALHKNGYMSDWIYRTVCLELSQRGYKTGEPVGMPAHESSRVFPQVLRADKDGTVTCERIATELALPADDVRVLMMRPYLEVSNGEAAGLSEKKSRQKAHLSLVR